MGAAPLFRGDQITCKAYLRRSRGYYVYVLRRPDGTPFYVGKGIGERVFCHENEARHPNDWRSNQYKLNVIRSLWRAGEIVQYEIDSIVDDEERAHARETELIASYRRLYEGGPLTNLSPGGGSSAGASPLSKEKHTATLGGVPDNNPERAMLNGFVLSIGPMRSVILKPLSQYTPRPTIPYPNKTMGPSPRQAVALVASAAANGISMDQECIIPRQVSVQGVDGCIENGVSCDIVTSRMAILQPRTNPREECFALNVRQSRSVVGMVGLRKCIDVGVLTDIAAFQ